MRSPYNFWFSKGSGAPQTICQQLAVQSLRKIHLALQSCTQHRMHQMLKKTLENIAFVQFRLFSSKLVTWLSLFGLLAEAGPLAGKVPGEPQRPQPSLLWELRFASWLFSIPSELGPTSLRSLAVSSGLRKGCPMAVQLADTAICCSFFLRFQTAKLLASGCRW